MGMEEWEEPSHGFPGRGCFWNRFLYSRGYVFLPFKCPGKGRCIIIAHLKGNFNDFITGIPGPLAFQSAQSGCIRWAGCRFCSEPIRMVEPVIVLYFRQLGHGEVFLKNFQQCTSGIGNFVFHKFVINIIKQIPHGIKAGFTVIFVVDQFNDRH